MAQIVSTLGAIGLIGRKQASGFTPNPPCCPPPPPRHEPCAWLAHAAVSRLRAPPPPFRSYHVDTPRPSPHTNRTRRVPHPVLIGHAASLTPY
jgi:hypothetical protein